MAGNLRGDQKMTTSQLSLRGVRVPAGHILVNEKYQGSLLVKVLQGSANIIFDNLGFLDFRPSSDLGVLFLTESELIGGNNYKQRIVKLAKAQTVRGLVLFEKTSLTEQYCDQLQKFTSVDVGLNLYPVSSQTEAANLLIQLVNLNGNPRNNQFLIKKSQKQVDQALLLTVQTIPSLGEKKALALIQHFSSLKELSRASQQELSKIIGNSGAKTVKSFFDSSTK